MKSYLRTKADLKKKFIKPGRLFGMNAYLLINRTYLQRLADLQNPRKLWKRIKVLMCCWTFFLIPSTIHKIRMLLKRSRSENSLKISSLLLAIQSEGKFGVWRGGTRAGWLRSQGRCRCCLRCWGWRTARRFPLPKRSDPPANKAKMNPEWVGGRKPAVYFEMV